MRFMVACLLGALPLALCGTDCLALVQTSAKMNFQTEMARKIGLWTAIRQAALLQGAPDGEYVEAQAHAFAEAGVTGATATLSEDGYREVAQLRNVEQMKTYMKRVIRDMGLQVLDEGVLSGVARWYDGECSQQSLAAMRAELHNSTSRKKGHNAWIEGEDGNESVPEENLFKSEGVWHLHDWNLHPSPQEFEDAKENMSTMAALIRDVVHRRGGIVNDKTGMQLVEFVMSVDNRHKEQWNLDTLVEELDSASEKDDGPILIGGEFAKLDEEGYMGIAARQRRGEMNLFVRRVIDREGLHLARGGVGEGGLNGMLPYYDGRVVVQSYRNLVKELNAVADKDPVCGGGWLRRS